MIDSEAHEATIYENGRWTEGRLTQLGAEAEIALDVMKDEAPVTYSPGSDDIIYGVGVLQTITSVVGSSEQITSTVSSPTRNMSVQISRGEGDTFTVLTQSKGRFGTGSSYIDSVAVMYKDGKPIKITSSPGISQRRINQLLERCIPTVQGSYIYLIYQTKGREYSLKAQPETQSAIQEQAVLDIQEGQKDCIAEEQYVSSKTPVSLPGICEVVQYQKLPERITLPDNIVDSTELIRGVSDGTVRDNPSLKGLELGMVYKKRHGAFYPSPSVVNESVPSEKRFFVGDEDSITFAIYDLKRLPPVSFVDALKADLHLHPFMTPDEAEKYIQTGEQPQRGMEGWTDMGLSTPEARRVLIDALSVSCPSYKDIVCATYYLTGGVELISSSEYMYALAASANTKVIRWDENVGEMQNTQSTLYEAIIREFASCAEKGEIISKKQIQAALFQYVKRICRQIRMVPYAGEWKSDEEAYLSRK